MINLKKKRMSWTNYNSSWSQNKMKIYNKSNSVQCYKKQEYEICLFFSIKTYLCLFTFKTFSSLLRHSLFVVQIPFNITRNRNMKYVFFSVKLRSFFPVGNDEKFISSHFPLPQIFLCNLFERKIFYASIFSRVR